MLEHKTNPSQATLDRLRHARSEAQREARRCANQYWTELCTSIQTASDVGDAGTMYSLMKVALGPRVSKTAPLKTKEGEAITDKTKQLDRWVEHYSELYSKEIAEKPRLEEVLPVYPELAELDAMPEESELLEALSALPSGKAPGQDGIPAEVLKENREVILPYLYELLRQCWEEGKVPNEMCNAKIVTLYKNKGDRGDCNNFRGISLLSITGKAIALIVRKRLQTLADRVLPESQCGFRAGRSTTDMIFTLRQLQEKCREQCMPLYIAFVDLTKAFDTVCRPALYKVLKSVGCQPKLLQLVVSFHEDMKACVQFDGATSDFFDMKNGVKQGCVMAPTLFSIYFAVLLRYAFKGNQDGVYIRSRTDGSLFNLARLRARSKTVESLCRELLFADDAALTAHKESALQGLLDSLARACDLFCLTISVKKTEILRRNRLRWLGHVARMDDNRLSKKILYGELSQGSRPRGRPKLRFKEKAANDRSKWRAAIHKGTELFKSARESRKAEARSRRKGPVEKSTTREYCCRFCGRACRARIGCTSHERRCPARPAESD
ncbi:hypothetical protein Bbelb_253640 [Branchiostoma belcheri]|nr:hypothetical protein Bbelb_253640 [Branchiostoma belcheri]